MTEDHPAPTKGLDSALGGNTCYAYKQGRVVAQPREIEFSRECGFLLFFFSIKGALLRSHTPFFSSL